ncbi:hypothetical protein J6590_053507, partial [Homalodisca vitripennis]
SESDKVERVEGEGQEGREETQQSLRTYHYLRIGSLQQGPNNLCDHFVIGQNYLSRPITSHNA